MKYGEFGHSWCERKYRVVVIDRDGVTLEPLAKTRMIGCACACSLTCRFADRVSYAAGLCRWAVSKARAEVQDPRALQRKRKETNKTFMGIRAGSITGQGSLPKAQGLSHELSAIEGWKRMLMGDAIVPRTPTGAGAEPGSGKAAQSR